MAELDKIGEEIRPLIVDPDKMELAPLQEVEEVEEDETIQQARKDGWVPQDEWKGEDGKWVDASEFLFRGELFDRIKKQSTFIGTLKKDQEELREALEEMGRHNAKIAEIERDKAMKELKAAKKEAFEDHDFDSLEQIDERMEELKNLDFEEEKPKQEEQQQSGNHPEVDAWAKENTWYAEDRILQGATNAIIQDLLEDDPSLEDSPKELLEQASKRVRKELPERFDDEQEEDDEPKPKRKRSAVSEGNSRPSTPRGKEKYSAKHLNEMQTKIGKTFVNSGAFKTLADYANDLAKMGELDIQKGE